MHQNKEADHSHTRTEEAKVLQAESPQPEDKLEGEIVGLLRSECSDTLNLTQQRIMLSNEYLVSHLPTHFNTSTFYF